jgi:hypothetical protein
MSNSFRKIRSDTLRRAITSVGIERGRTNLQSAMAREVSTLPEASVIIRPLP